jgi:hypothetical protein
VHSPILVIFKKQGAMSSHLDEVRGLRDRLAARARDLEPLVDEYERLTQALADFSSPSRPDSGLAPPVIEQMGKVVAL